jgi:A/G-specific adenine glycosylase
MSSPRRDGGHGVPTVHTTLNPSFAVRLVAWQRIHGRNDLPWQNTRDAYRIWLSEIMLQQTQVSTVLPYYAKFLHRFPTVGALAAAPDDDVMAHWAGLGYYSRARNLHRAAKQVVALHGGVFPADVALLAELPGIGRSTAAAIAAFAYDVIAPILDGNVKRVLARHAGIEGFPGVSAVEKKLWVEAETRLPGVANDMVAYTQGLMDLGATVCARSDPRCLLCPVAVDCAARISGRTHDIPAARPTKAVPQRAQRYLLLTHAEQILLVKRPAPGIWGGLWCLPELADAEDATLTAHTRYGASGAAGEIALPPIAHAFTHFRLTLQVTQLNANRIEPRAMQPGAMWIAREQLTTTALPAPIKKLFMI